MKAIGGWIITDLTKMRKNIKPSNRVKTQAGGEIKEKTRAPHSKQIVVHIMNTVIKLGVCAPMTTHRTIIILTIRRHLCTTP